MRELRVGDYVRCYGDYGDQYTATATLIGEVVGIGPKNLKVRTYYNPGGLPEDIEQIHKVAKVDVREVKRPESQELPR